MKAKGNVESKRRDGKGIKLQDGNWYSTFKSSDTEGVNRGDLVEFEYTQKGNFNNIQGEITVLTATPSSGSSSQAPASASKMYRPFPVPKDHGDRAIIRQNVLRHATSVVLARSSEDENLDYVVEAVVQVARELEKYATGELDAEALANLVDES